MSISAVFTALVWIAIVAGSAGLIVAIVKILNWYKDMQEDLRGLWQNSSWPHADNGSFEQTFSTPSVPVDSPALEQGEPTPPSADIHEFVPSADFNDVVEKTPPQAPAIEVGSEATQVAAKQSGCVPVDEDVANILSEHRDATGKTATASNKLPETLNSRIRISPSDDDATEVDEPADAESGGHYSVANSAKQDENADQPGVMAVGPDQDLGTSEPEADRVVAKDVGNHSAPIEYGIPEEDSPADFEDSSLDRLMMDGVLATARMAETELPEAPPTPVALREDPGDPSPSPAPSRRPAIFKDRRGAKRSTPAEAAKGSHTTEGVPALRQAEAKLRLTIDTTRKRVVLAAVLSRPEGFPESIDVSQFGEVLAFDRSRYDDIEPEWSPDLLSGEIRLRDESSGLEWVRSARPFQLFANVAGEPDLISVPAASFGATHAIICLSEDSAGIDEIAQQAGSPALEQLDAYRGVPTGWKVLTGFAPSRSLPERPPAAMRPLDPGAQIEITFVGGFEIRAGEYAQQEPPRVTIAPLPSGCEVFIDGRPAHTADDGCWEAPGWDDPGQHTVDVVPGPSRSFSLIEDPAADGGWKSWPANSELVSTVLPLAAVCGAAITCPEGRAFLASEPASSAIAIGLRQNVQRLHIRPDAPAAIALLHFWPAFLAVSNGHKRTQAKLHVLDLNSSAANSAMRPLDPRWVSTVRLTAARRPPITPSTPVAEAAWAGAARAARRWKRIR